MAITADIIGRYGFWFIFAAYLAITAILAAMLGGEVQQLISSGEAYEYGLSDH